MIPRPLFGEEHEVFRDQVRRFVDKEIVPHYEQWEREGKQYHWQPKVSNEKQDYYFKLYTWSKERYLFNVKDSFGEARSHHGVPEQITLFVHRGKWRYVLYIKFNRQEMFALFNRFDQEGQGKPFELQIRVAENLKSVSLNLIGELIRHRDGRLGPEVLPVEHASFSAHPWR